MMRRPRGSWLVVLGLAPFFVAFAAFADRGVSITNAARSTVGFGTACGRAIEVSGASAATLGFPSQWVSATRSFSAP
jgi:hypothetical protein